MGKSAVGGRLRKVLESAAVIEVDALRDTRADVRWTDREDHRLGLRQAAALAKKMLEEGAERAIVIDTFLGESLEYFIARVHQPASVFTLMAEDEVLLRRARRRPTGFQDEQVIRGMGRWFRTHRRHGEVVIDTTALSADEVAWEILIVAGV